MNPVSSPNTLLDPLLLAQLAGLDLQARTVVEGALSGRHRSIKQGQSLEFVGHRSYTPSDEWRRIDWKVYAKTDKWVVKEQQEETNLRAVLLLDQSASMSFHSRKRLPKIQYASILSAALAYLMIQRRESVGLGLFHERLQSYTPARGGRSHLAFLLDQLEQITLEGQTDFPNALEEAGQRLPRRGLVIVVSDFLAPLERLIPALKTLVTRRHEVVALQVLDPEERNFSFHGDYQMTDLETGRALRVNADEMAPAYRRFMAQHLQSLERQMNSLGIDYALLDTASPLDKELALYLHRRQIRLPHRSP